MSTSPGSVLLTLLLVGCPSADVDDDSIADDDTGVGDDDTVGPGDDDSEAQPSSLLATHPADGEQLAWNGCVELTFDGTVFGLTASAADDHGNELLPFAGFSGDTAHIRPMQPWPPGRVVSLQLSWLGGSATLEFPVPELPAADSNPSGAGGAFTTSHAIQCPDMCELLDMMIGLMHYGLFRVETWDGDGGIQVVLAPGYGTGYSDPQDHITQDLCSETALVEGTYSDPLLLVPTVLGLPGESEADWLAVQLGPDGTTPVVATWGMLLSEDDYPHLDALCEIMNTEGYDGCGACPGDPSARCFYHYSWTPLVEPTSGPVVERSDDDIAADPDCP